MKSRLLLNLVLLVLAVGLGLLAWFQPGIRKPPPPVTVTTLARAAIDRIVVHPKDHPALTLERRDGHWAITGATPVPADPFEVNTLLDLARDTAVRSYPAAGMDLAKLGLAPPKLTVTFNTDAIGLGATESLEGLRYAHSGGRVLLVTDRYGPLLQADLTTLASRNLLPPDSTVTGLHLPDLDIRRGADGHWQLTPRHPDATADAIQELLDTWAHGGALTVTAYTPGKDHPEGDILVDLKGRKTPVRFVLVAGTPKPVLARADLGLAYQLSPELGKELFALPKPPPTPDAKTLPDANDKPAAAPTAGTGPETTPVPAPAGH